MGGGGGLDGGRCGRTDRKTETRKEATGRQLDERKLRQREKHGRGCSGREEDRETRKRDWGGGGPETGAEAGVTDT